MQEDQYDNNDEFQYIGLGHKRNHKMTKNQQIYGDFYEAYEESDKMNMKSSYPSYNTKSAYSNFKAGSTIQNYAAQCDVHIPESKIKKKIKQNQNEDEEEQPNTIGQFNLKSFLQKFQQNQQLQRIEQEDQQQQQNGPLCLSTKIKNILKLIKLGQESDEQIDQNDISSISFQQYQKLVMRNRNSQNEEKKKKLTPEQKQKQKDFIEGYGVGYKMLAKMGYNLSKGLGKEQKGIHKPVEAVFKTSFTTKDSQLKQQSEKQQQSEKTQQQLAVQQQIFQYRSKNRNINNFLLDLKNKFESLKSKMYFYERQIQNFNRDYQINNSLKLQKQNQIQIQNQQLHKLISLLNYGKSFTQMSNSHKIKNQFPHLSLQYKMDILYLKSQYLKLKEMSNIELYEKFPDIIRQMKQFLFNLYLDKQIQTIKSYKSGINKLKDNNFKVINLEQDQVDIVDDGPTQQETIATLSSDDQYKIIRMIQIIAENIIFPKISDGLADVRHIGQIKNYKILQCIRALKLLNKNSEIVQRILKEKIKPLLFKYYESLELEQTENQLYFEEKQKQSILPHLVIFPLFQVLEPKQMQIHRLLKIFSKKLWSIKTLNFLNIIKPLLQFCSPSQKDNFINFYLVPRILYQLQEFDLSQPSICKQLMTGLKNFKQFLNNQIRKDLLDHTIIPQLVMTYKKYDKEGMSRDDLSVWIKRWAKQISKLVPHYLQQTFFNDFHIQI